MKFKKFTDNEKQQMAAEYTRGQSLKDLAQSFGVSIPTMATYVRAGGGIVRKPGSPMRDSSFVEPVETVNEPVVVETQPEPVVAQTRVLLSMD